MSDQGNRLSIFLLLLPVAALVVVFSDPPHLPINQTRFLVMAVPAALLGFAGLWWLGFRGVRMDRTLWLVGAFLLLLWMLASLPFVGWLNQAFDASATTTEHRRIVKTYYASSHGLSGQPKSSPSCMVWVDTPVAGTDVVSLRADYCALINGETDGVMLELKQGNLQMPWLKAYSLIRHYEQYQQRS